MKVLTCDKNRRHLLPLILSDAIEERERQENAYWAGLYPNGYSDDWWDYDEYGNYIGDDDLPFDEDDDDATYMFPEVHPKKGKGNGKSKANHKRQNLIHFYPDYSNEMDVVEFDTLSDFEVFCAEESIFVDDYAFAAISTNKEIFCCIDPRWLEYGYKYLYCDFKYSNMYYEVCKPEELG